MFPNKNFLFWGHKHVTREITTKYEKTMFHACGSKKLFLLMSKSLYTRIQGDIFYTLHCSVNAKNKKIAESQSQILFGV